MKKLISAVTVLFGMQASATVLYDAEIVELYAQENGVVHLVQFDKPLEGCYTTMNRAYIESDDTAMFSLLMAKYIADKKTDILYYAGPAQEVNGHLGGITCKIFSVF